MSDDLAPDRFDHRELLIVPERLLLPHGPVDNHAVIVQAGIFRDSFE